MGNPTFAAIAKHAGISVTAVSYALNGRPGVSPELRQRVLDIAADMGWRREETGVRTDAIGFIVARPDSAGRRVEPLVIDLLYGVSEVTSRRSIALMFHVAETEDEELEVFRKWWTRERIDGAIVMDVRKDDLRRQFLRELGVPVASIVDARFSVPGDTEVLTDDTVAARDVTQYLIRQGHRRIARVSGDQNLLHLSARTEETQRVAAEAGVSHIACIETDMSEQGGAIATRSLLAQKEPPTAIVFDNDLTAVGGLAVANQLGWNVPRDISIVAWDDSPLCRASYPQITAVTRDVVRMGGLVATALLDLIAGKDSPRPARSVASLTIRESTAPPAG